MSVNAKLHANAGRFRRDLPQHDQSTHMKEASDGRETTVHDGPLHEFVLVPVGVWFGEASSTHRLGSKPARTAISGIEPMPSALLWRPLPSHPAASRTKY